MENAGYQYRVFVTPSDAENKSAARMVDRVIFANPLARGDDIYVLFKNEHFNFEIAGTVRRVSHFGRSDGLVKEEEFQGKNPTNSSVFVDARITSADFNAYMSRYNFMQ